MKLHPASWSLFLLLAAGIVAAGFYWSQPRSSGTPDYASPTLEGETFDVKAQEGRVVVLDIFNVLCESCTLLEKELKTLHAQWDPENVVLASIGAGLPNSAEELADYRTEHGLNWTVVRDTDGAVEKFSAIGFPTLVILDPNGEIVFQRSGLATAAEINKTVSQALALETAPVEFARYSVWGLAIVGAVASFFSPCAVGLLPGYVGHTVRFQGAAEGGRLRRAAELGLIAAAGLLIVFLGIGALAYVFEETIAPYVPWMGPLVGILFVGVGFLLLVRPYSAFLQRVFSPLTAAPGAAGASRGRLGYFLYGIGYGAGSAGCTAPVLLGLVGLAYQSGPQAGLGVILLWAVTASLLMAVLTIIVAGGRAGVAVWIRRNAKKVETASALLFIGAGLFLVWFAWRVGTLAF